MPFPEGSLRLLGLFLTPLWSLESLRPHIALWEREYGRELEEDVVKWLRWLLTHGLVEVFEDLYGVDEVSTDEDAVRRYWFQLRPKDDPEFWEWFGALQESKYDRTVENGELVFRGFDSREIAWQGKPCGSRVRQHVPVPGSDDALALLNGRNRAGSNLVRVRPDGEIVWDAETRAEEGASLEEPIYYSVHLPRAGRVEAGDGSYAVILDVETGSILESHFTK